MTDQFGTPEVTSDDKLMAALAYIFAPLSSGILLLLEDKKNRPFIRFHAIQSLVVGVILIIFIPFIAAITFGCGGFLWLVMLYWAYKAYQGEKVEIPVITNFIKNQGWV